MPNVKVSPARFAAFLVLRKVAEDNGFSAILLPVVEADLQPEDRALCHEIVLGVLRNQTFLDALIARFSGKKIEKLDLPVLLALRIGIYQLRFLSKIPARAAVNESVNLIYAARLRSAANFVNAVLRNATRAADFDLLAAIENPLERLSVETSHPVWLLEKWQAQFGFDEAAKLAGANNVAPTTVFRLINLRDKTVLNELKEAGATLVESKIVRGAWQIAGASQKLRELAAANRVYVQDAASQLVAHVLDVKANESFLDVCAAPGSKTTLISSLRSETSNHKSEISNSEREQSQPKRQNGFAANDLQNAAANPHLFVAGDFSFARARILRETIERFASEPIAVVRYDAAKSLPFADSSFDCVLVDAPCSGTGTIRHNPEIRWHLQPADFEKLAAKQLRILTNAARLVKNGGRLLYSTCSLETEENEAVAETFLASDSNFKIVRLDLPADLQTAHDFARTFPHRDRADGFFIAAFKRES